MKRKNSAITNPDELNKNLSYSSFATWFVLTSAVILLIGFFTWSVIYKIKVKISGIANISGGEATLIVEETKLDQLKEGQKVYISGIEGQILSLNDNQPVVSSFSLDDGQYDYYIVVNEIRPIEFWFKKN